MGLKKAENQLKILIAETILSMCRNTLNYHAEICVEGLLGITLDNEEIFLVNLNQTIKNQVEAPKASPTKDKNLKRSKKEDEGSGSESDSSSSESGDSASKSSTRKKRRKRSRRKKPRSDSDSDDDNNHGDDSNIPADTSVDTHELNNDEKKYPHNVVGNVSENAETDFTHISAPAEHYANAEQYHDNDTVLTVNTDSLHSQDTPSSSTGLQVKQEPPNMEEEEDSDDDLVFVKEEMEDYSSCSQPSIQQHFSNLGQVFQSQPGDASLSHPDFMPGAFFNSPANNMSQAQLQQPMPGPSGANQGFIGEQQGAAHVLWPGRTVTMETAQHGMDKSSLNHIEALLGMSKRGYNRTMPSGMQAAGIPGLRTRQQHRCNLCGKHFNLPHDLVRHMRVHTGERPYVCDLCHKRFSLKGNLHKHRMRVHGLPSLQS